MRALSIRQPYAELILRGIKTAELRSRGTTIVGERFYIYASRARATPPMPIWSDDLRVGTPPGWMIELAEQVKLIEDLRSANGPAAGLPTGVIVGTAVIERVEVVSGQLPVASVDRGNRHLLATGNSQLTTIYAWQLADVRRIKTPRKPTGHPRLD